VAASTTRWLFQALDVLNDGAIGDDQDGWMMCQFLSMNVNKTASLSDIFTGGDRMCRVSRVLFLIGMVLSVGFGYATVSFAEMAKWKLDHDHSTIGFQVVHMVVSKTNGKFTEYSGVVEMDAEAQEFKSIEAVIQTLSVTTDHQKRDEHLRSPDFFDVQKFPTMTYTMKSYQKTGDTYTAAGELTLLGVTKEITLVGTFNGVAQDPWGNTRAGFTGTGTINRKDFGMKFSKLLDNGGMLVGDEVKIILEIEVIKEKKAEKVKQ
jgi:polyisoprenoid-binding protein YceI